MDFIVERIAFIIPLVLSLSVHEWAHAYAAYKLGDDTAMRLGRMTLDPTAHLDPLGTLLPLLGVPFGWAKPVPINPVRFKVSMGLGVALTAAAGPASNLVLAVILGGFYWVTRSLLPQGIVDIVAWSMMLNIALAVFNLLPIPPLDGSRIADEFMPKSLESAWAGVRVIGPIVLMVVIIGPMLMAWQVFQDLLLLTGGSVP